MNERREGIHSTCRAREYSNAWISVSSIHFILYSTRRRLHTSTFPSFFPSYINQYEDRSLLPLRLWTRLTILTLSFSSVVSVLDYVLLLYAIPSLGCRIPADHQLSWPKPLVEFCNKVCANLMKSGQVKLMSRLSCKSDSMPETEITKRMY
jgi:hypothetical protein